MPMSSHSLFLLNDGTVKSCGKNTYGQLGDGTTANKSTPITISGLSGVKQISCGNEYSLFLLNDGTVKACGNNNWGQLGDSNIADKSTPTLISGLSNIKSLWDFAMKEFLIKYLMQKTPNLWYFNIV